MPNPTANMSTLRWIGDQIWQRWVVVGTIACAFYAAGVTAMYSDAYIAANVLYCCAIALLTAKAIYWEETKDHAQRKRISFSFLAIGAILLAGSFIWNQFTHRARLPVPEVNNHGQAALCTTKIAWVSKKASDPGRGDTRNLLTLQKNATYPTSQESGKISE